MEATSLPADTGPKAKRVWGLEMRYNGLYVYQPKI